MLRALLIIALLATAACVGDTDSRPPLILEIQKAEYTPLIQNTNDGTELPPDRTVQLNDGKWEAPRTANVNYGPYIQFDQAFEPFTDIDQDGTVDALATLYESLGGTGVVRVLAVFNRIDGKVRDVATQPLGDRIKLRSIHATPHQIVAVIVEQSDTDPLCCPTVIAEYTWRYAGRKFTLVSKRLLGREDPQ